MKKPQLIIAAALAVASMASHAASAAAHADKQQTVHPDYLRPGGVRKFSIVYNGKVSAIPEGTKMLRVWAPAPLNTTAQKIEKLDFTPRARLTTERRFGNRIAYWELDNPPASFDVTMRFICTRREILIDLERVKADGREESSAFAPYREPDRLVLVDEEMRKLAGEVTAGQQSTVEKARALYDYVLSKMTYDKNHAGWGLGSTRHACDVGKGNCTDFHALFNSLCRAEGIASGFEIGLYLPYEKGKQEPLGGYHCWAFFRVPGKTWVPVDCSEADRFAERKEYFFGNHTPNRVTLSTGRDLVLEPKQAGEPLNYFLNPYAEADGQPVKTDKSWSFADID